MYIRFYRLGARPFQLIPDPRFFFASRAHRRALAQLSLALAQAEGLIVVTGETGSGKSLLVDVLGEQLGRARMRVLRLDRAPVDSGGVLMGVAIGLGLDANLPAALPESVEGRLRALARAGRRVLLVVDDAHGWRPAALETLRRLSDLRRGGRALIQILLLGQPDLERRLATPALEHLRERIVMGHRLDRLGADEVAGYVEHRLVRAGWAGDPIFAPDAIRAIAAASAGLPRRINRLCARLLMEGSIQQRHVIDGAAVARAVDEGALAGETGAPREGEGIEPRPAGIGLADEGAGGPTGSMEQAPMPPSGGGGGGRRGVSGEGIDEPDEQMTASDDGLAAPTEANGSVDRWWIEVARVQRQLERVLDELSDERQKRETVRAEADRLRTELHRVELDRLRVEAETARRTIEALGATPGEVASRPSRGRGGGET